MTFGITSGVRIEPILPYDWHKDHSAERPIELINSISPSDWKDLQLQVARILHECGMQATTDQSIETVRGQVNVDVFAEDSGQIPAGRYICECKHWSSRVPKTVVHGFRTVVADFGANLGFLISSAGFQSGAYEAAEKSNVKLLDWQQFEDMFEERWVRQYMIPLLRKETDALIFYAEPIKPPDCRLYQKAELLPDDKQQRFIALRDKHQSLECLSLSLSLPPYGSNDQLPKLPLRTSRSFNNYPGPPSDSVLDATSRRGLLEAILTDSNAAIADFDELFGGRAYL